MENPVMMPGDDHDIVDMATFGLIFRFGLHTVRQHINARLVDVLFCRTNENLADFFTKSLAFPQFDNFRNIIMNSDRQYRLEWSKTGKELRDKQQRG